MPDPAPLMLSVSGCRGIIGQSLTPEVAARFAGCFGGWLRDRAGGAMPRVVLSRDGRAGWQPFHAAAVAGLTGAGCAVIDAGVAMTPTVAVLVDDQHAAGGIVLTASHNPQPWNGLKCIVRERGTESAVNASAPDAAIANQIIERFHAARPGLADWDKVGSVAPVQGQGVYTHPALVARAIDQLPGATEQIRVKRFKPLLDSVNASGASAGKWLLEGLGCDLWRVGCKDTGIFPHAPEPTRENLASLCEAVQKLESDLGFAQDPDGDRLAIIDDKGRYIGEEYTFVLAAESLLSAGAPPKGAVLVTNLSTSRMIDDVAARYGARVIRTVVGEANVVAAMKREGALLGGEGNGGVIWPKVTYIRDSLGAMALVLALMARTGKKISQLVAAMPAYAIVKRKVALRDRAQAARSVDAVAAAYTNARQDHQDGVRVDWDDQRAWLHVRASNTEPIMRLIAEAPTEDRAAAILDLAASVIG